MQAKNKVRLIGREDAQAVLAKAYTSDEASLVSVVGRRRIGKTYLINRYFADRISFSVTGIAGASS